MVGGDLFYPHLFLYKMGLLPASRMRPLVSKVAFFGVCEQRIKKKAQAFVSHYLPTVMRKSALDKIAQHKQNGDRGIGFAFTLCAHLV